MSILQSDFIAACEAASPAAMADKIDHYLHRWFGSHQRPDAFLDIINDEDPDFADSTDLVCLDNETVWRALHLCWDGFDRIPHKRYAKLFKSIRRDWSAEYLGDDDRKFYETLSDRFTAYRGQDVGSPVGLSWTLDREIAAGFARGHRWVFNPRPVILTAQVLKRDVAGAYVDRGESEIILFSPRHATERKLDLKPALPKEL